MNGRSPSMTRLNRSTSFVVADLLQWLFGVVVGFERGFRYACPLRPNLIAVSRCKVLSVKINVVEINEIDAFPDTLMVDLKS